MALVQPVLADGIIVPPVCPEGRCPPPPPICDPGPCPRPIVQLNVRYHHVSVKIDNQLAVTHVDQVFYNPNDWPIEGSYIFPLPAGAAVNQFILWVDGKPVEGKILDAKQARQTYEEIVRSLRDPALLEYVGRGAVQAHIFPIPPKGERRIELEYSQVLPSENGLVHYVYPLNTEKFSKQPLETVSVKVEITDHQSIRAVYSPSHTVAINKKDENHVEASYEASQVTPDKDFTLFYSLGETEAFHLLSYRDPGDPTDPDGFFMLLLAPAPQELKKPIAKDVLLVLDHSGSMDGEKFKQVQSALRYILKHLNPEDRFYLEAFNSNMENYASSLRPASEADQAIAWVDRLSAAGSTDINRALLEASAVADRERPTYLIFMTDGLPTEGVTQSQDIIQNFNEAAPANLRMFPFGVGYDVDTYLLDSLSEAHHGLSTYVQPGSSLDEALSSFYTRISTPVLTNLKLDFSNLAVYDLYPNPLPDLFEGSQVVVVGRYREGKVVDLTLSGDVNGINQTLKFPEQRFVDDSRSAEGALTELPRLWATRKIGYLLNKIRLQGVDQETVDQIVKLSIRYGIVTPYTSYLVTESMPLGAENQERVAQNAYNNLQAAPTQVSGQGAVKKAADQGGMSQAEVAPGPSDLTGQKVRIIGSRTFVFNDEKWVDTTFDPDKMKPIPVAFLSPDYFALAQSRPDLGAALAVGEKVIIVVDGKAYEVVAEGSNVGPLDIPATSTPMASENHPAITPTQELTVDPSATQTSVPPADPPVTQTPAVGVTQSVACPGAVLTMIGVILAAILLKKRLT
jgi:Ca-activated chloride channel family protein